MKFPVMGSSSGTLDEAAAGNHLDPPAPPFTPLFFIGSPEPLFPLMDCLENLPSPVRQNNNSQPPESDPVTVMTDNNLSSQQNQCTNQAKSEDPEAYVELFNSLSQQNPGTDKENLENPEAYALFFDSPKNNVPEGQQHLENSDQFYESEKLPSDQRERSFLRHKTPIFPDNLMQERTQTYNPTMMDNNQQAGQVNGTEQANMVNPRENSQQAGQITGSSQANMVSSREFKAFEFQNNLQAEHQRPLTNRRTTREMDQPNPVSSVYDQLVQNFSDSNSSKNNDQAVPNLDMVSQKPIEARVHGNIKMQRQNPLYMPPPSTGGPWLSNQHCSSSNMTPDITKYPERHNPVPPTPLILNRPQNYPSYSSYQHDAVLPSPKPLGQQDFSSLRTRPTLLRPLQPHHFSGLSSTSVLPDDDEPLSLKMARASARMRFLNGQHHPGPIINPRTYSLLNQAPMPTLTGPLQDISLLPRPQSLLTSIGPQSSQGLVNQTSRTSSLNPGLGNQQQGSYVNSETQEIGGHLNEQPSTRPYPFGTSTNNYKEKGILGQRSHRESFEHGQSSKRPREENSRSESTRTSLSPEENSGSISANPSDFRPAKNAVYDPLFEGLGLPVDPHLRLFGTS